MIPPSILARFTMSNDADCTGITLPLSVFATSLTIVFTLGGCVGFFIGEYRARAALSESSRQLKETQPSLERLDDTNGKQELQPTPSVTNNNEINVNYDEREEDGPTMVLRGSLELMASKWGCNNVEVEPLSSQRTNNNTTKSSGDCRVVEYLSPHQMTKLLFSKSSQGEENVILSSETLCLDETTSGSSTKNKEVSSPKSSATDIVNLLFPSKKTSGSIGSHRSKQDGHGQISPQAFLNLLQLIQTYSVNTSHPYFFNQLFGSLDPIALAAEVVALSVNTSVYTYETAPVFTLLEREVMGQIGRLVFGPRKENEKIGDDKGDKDQEEKDGIDQEKDIEEDFKGEGIMIPGGSLANLTALHAARHRWQGMNGYNRQKEQTPMETLEYSVDERSYYEVEEEKKMEDISTNETSQGPREQQQTLYAENQLERPNLVAFVSSEAHYSFSKSARVLGLHEDDLIVIPTCSDGRMDVEALAKNIEMLELELETSTSQPGRTRKRVPFFVACTAGSTVRGSFDDVANIVQVCRSYESCDSSSLNNSSNFERSIWVHVDGAWGGSAIFSTNPTLRKHTHMDDIRHADSFTFNPHKMLGAPQQTTAFIVRHRNALRNANAAGAKYLFDPRKNGAEYDLGDLSYTCGRRTDAVKLWALWKYYGKNGLGKRVDQKVDELKMFVKELKRRHGRFSLACKPWPFNVNFFYFPPRIRKVLEERELLIGMRTSLLSSWSNTDDDDEIDSAGDNFIQIPDDLAQDLANVSVQLKLRLHEAGEMIIPYQPLNNQKADCFRLVLAGKKDFGMKDICHVLDTMEKYGADL